MFGPREKVLSKEKRKVQWLKFYDPDPEAENSLEAPNLRSGTATRPDSRSHKVPNSSIRTYTYLLFFSIRSFTLLQVPSSAEESPAYCRIGKERNEMSILPRS